MEKNKIEEMSLEEGNSADQLKDLLAAKAKEKLDMSKNPDLSILKKSRFYQNKNNLREHIANYRGYSILIKQEHIKEDINDKEVEMYPSIVLFEDLKKMKRVNGNIIRKKQPKSIHEFEKIALVQGVMDKIDEIKENA